MKVRVGNKLFNVAVADDDSKRQIGLSRIEKMGNDEGLLMVFDEADKWPIRMSDMSFPLDLVFINDDKVVKISHAKAGSKDVIPTKPYNKVLEVNFGKSNGIKSGDAFSEVGEKKEDGTIKMANGGLDPTGPRHVLDEDGKVQGNLLGEERIFSRKDTAKLIKLANDKAYKKLGKAVVEMIHRQDAQPPEYANN